MANPIVIIMSVAGVVGVGATATVVNTNLLQGVAQDPVVVTVEGEPYVIDGGVEAILPPAGNGTQQQTQQRDGSGSVTTAPVTPADQAAQPTVTTNPPATHTGASGATGGGEQEDSEQEEADETEYEDDSYEDSVEQEEESDD